MKLLDAAAALLLAALAGCASTPEPEPTPNYFVMRHLQKAPGPDPALSEEGERAAQRLAAFLNGRRISAIFVSATRRARETAAPLAARLGLTPREYDPADTPALVARVREERGPVLVVGHSNTVPDIVEQLGGARPEPIADDRYGDVWHIRGSPAATIRMNLEGLGSTGGGS